MTGAILPEGADAVLMQGPGPRRPRRPPGPADGAPGLRHPAFHGRGRFLHRPTPRLGPGRARHPGRCPAVFRVGVRARSVLCVGLYGRRLSERFPGLRSSARSPSRLRVAARRPVGNAPGSPAAGAPRGRGNRPPRRLGSPPPSACGTPRVRAFKGDARKAPGAQDLGDMLRAHVTFHLPNPIGIDFQGHFIIRHDDLRALHWDSA
jgi:hypothetical protein